MILMFYLKEFHIYLSFESVGEMIIEGITQHSIYKLFNEFY